MSLSMNRDVFITCAITGSGDTVAKSDKVPFKPADIASSAIDAARAGAAVVHIHVRDPETGAPGRDPALFKEVVDRIRDSDVLSRTATAARRSWHRPSRCHRTNAARYRVTAGDLYAGLWFDELR